MMSCWIQGVNHTSIYKYLACQIVDPDGKRKYGRLSQAVIYMHIIPVNLPCATVPSPEGLSIRIFMRGC